MRSENQEGTLLFELDQKSQICFVQAIGQIQLENSEKIIRVLDESRFLLREALEEFKREQREFRKQLEQIKQKKIGKQNFCSFLDENSVSDEFLRSNIDDLKKMLGSNQTTAEKAAIIKYLKIRERRKRAEDLRRDSVLTEADMEKEIAVLLARLEQADSKMENERQRQNDRFRKKIREKMRKGKDLATMNGILDEAIEASLAREKFEKVQREKIEARLVEARHQSVKSPLETNRNENLTTIEI